MCWLLLQTTRALRCTPAGTGGTSAAAAATGGGMTTAVTGAPRTLDNRLCMPLLCRPMLAASKLCWPEGSWQTRAHAHA